MKRTAIEELKKWQQSKRRKPLVLRGARQVGKTWLLKNFGAENYESVAYFNLENNKALAGIFDLDYNTDRIIKGLENFSGQKISPKTTLVILDEIQEVPRALESLKYFCEDAPEYHVAVAGSLLGVALHQDTSFPVGKVNFIDILPMSFCEFLMAMGKTNFAELLVSGKPEDIFPFHEVIFDLYRQYVLVGGMPEVVKVYTEGGNFADAREVQREILNSYEQDFSKHAPVNVVPKIREVFDILPNQLAKENKKFIFSLIREGARAKDYEAALLWLEDAGIARRVKRINAAKKPISTYADMDIFKVFMLDTGLLGAKAELDFNSVLAPDNLFAEFKGALSEQAVFSMLRAEGMTPFYFANDDSRGEIDFIIEHGGRILPIEVKSGKNLQSKSLNSFLEKHTEIGAAIKFSILPYNKGEKIVNMPLYLPVREDLI